MPEANYGLIEANKFEANKFPSINLLWVPYKGEDLYVAHPAFGPNSFKSNSISMRKSYTHPQTGEPISFCVPTTAKSIAAASYQFGSGGKLDAQRDIFNALSLQAGWTVRTPEGVIVNPPYDAEGNPITDAAMLNRYIDRAENAEGIRLGKNDFGFAPNASFQRGVQPGETFARGGLARILEHANRKEAPHLRRIVAPAHYPNGVDVCDFEPPKRPELRVVSLGSDGYSGGTRLRVSGVRVGFGYAFGVLESGDASTPKN